MSVTTNPPADKPNSLRNLKRSFTRLRRSSSPEQKMALFLLLQTFRSKLGDDLAAAIEQRSGQVPAALDAAITDAELCQSIRRLNRQLIALVLRTQQPGVTANWLLPSLRQQVDYLLCCTAATATRSCSHWRTTSALPPPADRAANTHRSGIASHRQPLPGRTVKDRSAPVQKGGQHPPKARNRSFAPPFFRGRKRSCDFPSTVCMVQTVTTVRPEVF